ncbi:MAG: hydantoinase/oxoprolinase N-terminal domain-containing protein [Bdellovibrionota bacterium]|nr:hydantoinase/oxoprolinase N-terminal domain-containing protein [Bdellovibrionota bacterium]
MQNRIGIHIGMSFLEIAARVNDEEHFRRYFLAEISESDAIDQFLSELKPPADTHLHISTKWTERIVEKRIGAQMAMFVTEGFQNWPQLRQPAFNKRVLRQPYRNEAVIPSDYIFGISERTDASGKIDKSANIEELEFLHSKLQLMNIKTISIGFLHSHKNPENEQQVAKYFKELGYEVLCSHMQKEANEVSRWWRSAMDGYVYELFHEYRANLKPVFEKYNLQPHYIDNHSELFTENKTRYFASRFGRAASLKDYHNESQHILYLGLEEFTYINPQLILDQFESEFGPIAVSNVQQQKMGIQPTQIISPCDWKIFQFEKRELGFEPGPMLMGKSVTPCFLDLLFVNGQMDSISSLEKQIRPNSKSRILESMYTYTKDTEFEGKLDDLVNQMRETAYKKLCIQLGKLVQSKEKIIVSGPLAKMMYPEIKSKIKSFQLELDKDSDFIDSLAARELGA